MIKEQENARKMPTGVPSDCKDITFGKFIDIIAEKYARLPAIVCADVTMSPDVLRKWTYSQFHKDVLALHAGLIDLGIKPGDRVAVMLSSFPEWITFLFAVTRLGAIFVPVNTRYGTSELCHILAHSECSALVAIGDYMGRDYAGMVSQVVGEWSPEIGSREFPSLRRIIGVRNPPHDASIDTDKVMSIGRRRIEVEGQPTAATDPNATAILFYTSGTTASPKGVPLTHANLLPHSIGCGRLLGINSEERVLTLYPFFGISGGANKLLSTFGSGACLVFQDSFRASEAFELLENENCSVVHGVDIQFRELIRVAMTNDRQSALPDRRATIAFMAGVDAELAHGMRDYLGIRRFIHAYGMTETNPMILRNELSDSFEDCLHAGGRIAPGVEIRVLDPGSAQEAPTGDQGEIVVRGHTVAKEYFRDPAGTSEAFRDGFFHTGDLGIRTDSGMIFYAGRLKDMLKIGGFNVAPQEIEQHLRTHPAVDDVGVTGKPDPRLGEVAVAFVKVKAGHSVTADALRNYCRNKIANFKVVRDVHFVDSLPYHVAAHGAKLQRQRLREWALRDAGGYST